MKIFAIKFTAFFLACYSCYILQFDFHFSPVFASATVGFLGSFLEKKDLHTVIYAGSFAGMCSLKYLSAPQYIVFISLVGAGLYLVTKPHAKGFGGKLGTIAFLSSVILLALRQVW